METHQRHVRQRARTLEQRFCLPGLNGCAELGVHLSGGDRFVGMRIDPRRQPQQDALLLAKRSGNEVDRIQLLVVIRHKVTDALLDRILNLRVGLVIAVEIGLFHRESRQRRRVDFPGGHNVDAHTLAAHDFVHPLEGRGLAGVQRPRIFAKVPAERAQIHAAVFADARFVHEIQRRTVLLRKLHGIVTCKIQRAVPSLNVIGEHNEPPRRFFISSKLKTE